VRWSVHCRSSECDPPGGTWLPEVAELVGFTQTEILADPSGCLSDFLDGQVSSDRPEAQLPTLEALELKQRRLWECQSAVAYLRTERCLTEKIIREYQLGWDADPPAFTFPIINRRGLLVNVVRRPLPSRAPKYVALRGRNRHNGGVQLYPDVPDRTRDGKLAGWLLVEGLLDALLGRQGRLPTVTSTHGVSTFLDEWLPLVRGRRVAVMYDVGAEQVTRHRVEQLRAAGADAWAVDLSVLLGDEGKDLTDYVSLGGSRDELVADISAEYLRSKR
jgi:hypothetical protein